MVSKQETMAVTVEEGEAALSSAPSPAASAAPTAAAAAVSPAGKNPTKKLLGGLGSYLPKVPTYLLQKKDGKDAGSSSRRSSGCDAPHDSEPVDELGEMPTLAKSASTASTSSSTSAVSRLRGLSLDQNAFANSLARKFSGFRQSSTASDSSPRVSIDGSRRSLTGQSLSPNQDPNAKARRGACVATSFGTGIVLDIRPDDGFYVVELVPKSVAYLREENIIREIKAVVGERVKTRWGLATVEQYYVDEDMYSIALDWRWDDDHVWRMKATTKKFEKINRGSSIVQHTKNRIFEGYSTIRESASFGYANVAAKINTTASTYKSRAGPGEDSGHQQHLGKVMTPYGVCSVVEVRADQFFVVRTKCGATAYLNADSVKMLHRRTHFAAGDRVKTPYGVGEVVEYRDEDEMYEVKLEVTTSLGASPPTLFISDVHAETMMAPANAGQNYNARLSSIFNMTRNSMVSASATVKASASGGLNTLSNVKAKVSTMAAIKMTKVKFQKGERVITAFGSGYVTDVRPLERIYEVNLRRLKFTGYFHESGLTAFPYERVTHFVVDGKTIPAPEMPRNMPDHKRRNIINTAIRQAREGK
ncbi:hypothetical protein P43SY_005047 [Pythium insidiosum]|uniref:Uncharacterized protein n=1 Tax=Pythium insidiosum TaxID=114742 RepID=A0AAD5Q8L5_PYTIN|nr:hypothetical protein P43SY_005047 [Pythium insidiosum]